MRIGIIGMGWVGSSVAISTLHAGIAQELWVDDVNGDLAEGEAMDLAHGGAFYPTARVRRASIEEMRGCDAVVIAAGRGGRPDQSRLDLLRENAAIVRSIGMALRGARGVLVMVTNPVDVLTHVIMQAAELPRERVIGTGTMLDTARLRHAIGRELGVDSHSVHAHVVGEHGDSEVVLWSGARIGSTALRSMPAWKRSEEPAIATEVRTSAYQIIRRKGATNHAIGLVTARVLAAIVRDEKRVMTVSLALDGAMGMGDVALSLPTVVGAGGGERVWIPEMDDVERDGLMRSADVLQRAVDAISEPA